jgi:GH25 family lysozyme M1 (1,4-beta-N-acetylmuramidase)
MKLRALLTLAATFPLLSAGAVTTTTGLAWASGTSALAHVTHPGLDHAGSEVAKHEPHSGVPVASPKVTRLKGLDVSSWQGNVDWPTAKAHGARFAYVKATEGTGYTNPYFAQQYNGSYNVGLIRGAYHFALPDVSDGTSQADFFVSNGGGWSRDGKTLPPLLDIEYNPYGATCYGLSQSGMASWIQAFSNEVHARTSRYPTVYTTSNWWSTCTGNWSGLGATNPLFIACYCGSPGTLPAGWASWTFWQYSNQGIFPGDQDNFNGTFKRLIAVANG